MMPISEFDRDHDEPRASRSSLPYVLLSCAVSLDGFLDDPRGPRLIFSSEEDRDAVDRLRAQADAILIGAGTARRDDPELVVRAAVRRRARELAGRPPTPLRVVVTRSGDLPSTLRVLREPLAPTLVFCPSRVSADLLDSAGSHVTMASLRPFSLEGVLRNLRHRGCDRVLVEGGDRLSSALLKAALFDELRIATAPVLVGSRQAPRFGGHLRSALPIHLDLLPWGVEAAGSCAAVHWTRPHGGKPLASLFLPSNDAQWLAEAIQLSRQCLPSARAYSVGAVLLASDGSLLATGYSRELDDHCHAEEVALRKAEAAGLHVAGGTLYTSMEPCSARLSGRPSCTERILRAGLRRVVYAMREPPLFVRCQGHARLMDAGLEVIEIRELGGFVSELQQHLTP